MTSPRLPSLKAILRLRSLLTAGMIAVGALTALPSPALAATYQIPNSIPEDCSVDSTAALLSWIASVPNNSTLSLGAGGCYRIEGTLELRGRTGLDLEGNGATLRSVDPPSDQRALWRIWDSSGIVMHNMTLQGSYTDGGTYDASIEHAHGIDLRGTNASISRVTMRDFGGDCVYFGLGGTAALARSSGSVEQSSCTGTGRNAISVTAGNGILVKGVTATAIGYDVFDVEPNIGAGWGARSVTFEDNTIGTYAKSAYSLVENAPISRQAFVNNRVTGRGLKITVGQSPIARTSYPVSGVTISGNAATDPEAPAAMNLSLINGLTVSGNHVPVSGGALISVDSACAVSVSGNTFSGGAAQATIAPYACPTSSISAPNPKKRTGKSSARATWASFWPRARLTHRRVGRRAHAKHRRSRHQRSGPPRVRRKR